MANALAECDNHGYSRDETFAALGRIKSMRGCRHIQPSISRRAGQTCFVLDVIEVFAAEFAHGGDDRADCGVAEGAKRFAADVLGQVQEQVRTLLARVESGEIPLQR